MPANVLRRWVLLFLLSAAPGCSFAPRVASLPAGGTEVVLSLANHQPGVDVLLNGRGPYRVLVDTGASPAVAVSPTLARRLGLRRELGYVRLRAANGKWVRAARATLRSVRLGGAEFRDVPAVILDAGAPEFDGVIGMGLFSRGVVTFHFPSKRLSLRPGELDTADPDTLAARFVHGVPLVPVSPPLRDGRRVTSVLLDTGSNGGLVLPAELKDELDVDDSFSGRVVGETLGGPRHIELVKVRGKVRLGRYDAADPVVGLAPGRGAIGTPALLGFDVSIDQRSKRVRLKLVPPGSPATAAARCGPRAR